MFRKIVQPFYTTYVVITFVLSFLFIFPLILLYSWGKNIAARKKIINITRVWFRLWLWTIGMPLQIIGKKQSGTYTFIANHTSYIDNVLIVPAIQVHFRPLGKTGMTKIPLFGYFYKQLVILVDRNSDKSRATSMRQMLQHLQKEGSILIFPEGTFNETEKPLKEFYDGAFRLAIIAQISILPMIFPDAADRWSPSAWWKFWPGRNRAVCLDPVPVGGLTIEDVPMLKQQVYTLMENALIKYSAVK